MRIMVAAALLLLLVLLAPAAATGNTTGSCQTPYRERSEEETRRLFEVWKAEHNTTYKSLAEEERGYAIFKDDFHHVRLEWHKKGCPRTWDICDTDRSEEETRRIFMEWTAEHSITYSTADEEERAYAEFRYRLCEVDRQWDDDGYPAWSWDRERSEEEMRQIFVAWKAREHKSYSSIYHEQRRYAMFRDALHEADRDNAAYAIGVRSSGSGISQFSDLTHEEYLATCCGFWPHDKPPPSPAELRRVDEIQKWLREVYALYSG